MTLDEFRATLAEPGPPEGISLALQSLWYDAKGDWQQAHTLAQAQDDSEGAWVHAYLHRVEGDLANAGYWYQRANRVPSSEPLGDEWDAIVQDLLARS